MTKQAAAILNARRKRAQWVAVFLRLAVLVIAATGGIFHLTAITKTHQKKVLTCTTQPQYGEGYAGYFIHTHNDDCFDEDRNLICPLPEISAHEHSDSCYTTYRTLTCTVPESDDHQHSDECYETGTELTCHQPVLHTHDASCYDNGILVCGLLELTVHVHGPECFTMVEMTEEEVAELVEDTQEKTEVIDEPAMQEAPAEGPTVDDGAAGTDNTETETPDNPENENPENENPESGKPVKEAENTSDRSTEEESAESVGDTGTEEQVEYLDGSLPESDPNADVQTAADWTQSFADVELTGHWGADVVLIAESQLGYTESGLNFIVDADGTLHGYTRYGAKYGAPYIPWDAAFASFCIEYAKVADWAFPLNTDTGFWVDALSQVGKFAFPRDYTPGAGDLIFFDDDEDGKTEHCGIVTAYGEDENGALVVVTIEGDRDAWVESYIYNADESAIFGYGKLPENPNAPVEEAPEEEPEALPSALPTEKPDTENTEADNTADEEPTGVSMPAQSFYGETSEVAVYVEAPEGAFPAWSYMTVAPVHDAEILNAAADTVKTEVNSLCAVDICFFDSQGQEIEPLLPIRVTMTSSLVIESEDTVVVHVDDEGAASQVENTETGERDVTFEADNFSVYVLIGTTIEKRVITADGQSYMINVNYGPETGIPADAELDVAEVLAGSEQYETYVAMTENALGMEEGSAGYIRLFDIKIVDKDDHSVKYQPKEGTTVDVRIELADKDSSEEAAASTQVVHFADGSAKGDAIEAITDGQIVSFETSGFSIYAIVDSAKRLQYNFYDGTNLLVSEYIKKQDNVLQELYDPGVEPEYGQTFIGWAYSPSETNPSNIYTIEELNQQAAARYNSATEELTEINVYAIYDEAWYLRYMDQDAEGNATVLNVVRVRKDAANKNVTIDYTYTPEEGIVFEGWMDVATGQIYQQGEIINLDHHVDLYLKVHGRNWLVFDANAGGPGSGATYTPPQLLIGSEATTTKPADPTRRGYTFTGWNTKADGTGTWWYKPDNSVNLFGDSLSTDTTLYAQWEADDTDYYVVFWKQKADATGTDPAEDYDYISSERRTEKTGETVSTTTADRQKGGNVNQEYGYYYIYNADISDTTATVDANGTTILNVYYDRREITYNFTRDVYIYTQTTNNTGNQFGIINGEYVELVRSGNRWNYYQYTPTTSNSNNSTQYALVDGEYVQLTRYTQYGQYVWSYDGRTIYTGTRYTRSQQPYNNGLRYYRTESTETQSFSGLYGSSFADWPDPGNGRVWTYGGYLFPLALTVYDPLAAYNGNSPNTFTDTTITFTSTTYSSGNTLYIYVQTEDGSWSYSDDYLLTTASIGSNSTWYPTETFAGYAISGYQVGTVLNESGTWMPITTSGSIQYTDENIYLRYTRNQHKIHFISQGSHVTGRTEHIIDEVYFDSSISNYEEGGPDYYEPDNGVEGYYFAGWYSDPDCQIPFDFNTKMPDSDITVYAKWDTYRVRTVLVPTPNNTHNDEVEFANNQALSFRLDYNEQVDDTNIKSSVAKRPGYKLIGWYYSPDFDPATEVHFPVLINNNTPGVDMNYQSGEDWSKYGDNDGSHDNVRGILKLYAKWELDVDENSVYVEYDVDDVYRTYDTAGMLQTTIPVDDNKYALTNNNVTFQVAEAPTEYTSGFEFYRWVLLNPDGSESDIMYNPADTASEVPSSFIYEETITDDLGQTATIKKIRLKAKFNIETEKVTTVTFDGNGGVTNDSAQQESVTESYPINKDFLMKDGDSFVREGYKLLGWAFEREDGSKITPEAFKQAVSEKTADELIQAGIYQLGQKVAADNLEVSDENNWNPLENTVYAVWEINTYTVTVKKIVDGEIEEQKTFDFTATALGDYTLSDTDASFALLHGETKTIVNVPYGTELTFMETPAPGYTIKSVEAKQTTKPDNTPLSESEYIDVDAEDGRPISIKGDTVITYTNEKAKEQKLRIKKIGDDEEASGGLAGAEFSLTSTNVPGFDNKTGLVSMDGTVPANLGFLPSGDTAAPTVYTLPEGTYTLSETTPPDRYYGVQNVTITVSATDVTFTKGNDTDTVAISGPDTDNIYTLTVTDVLKTVPVKVLKVDQTGATPVEGAVFYFVGKGFDGNEEEDVSEKERYTSTKSSSESTEAVIISHEAVPIGTYILHEETAPAGYHYLEGDVEITISSGVDGTVNAALKVGGTTVVSPTFIHFENGTWVIKIMNTTGYELPSTGGVGTTIFYVVGGVMALAALVILVTKKRMDRD